MSQDHGRRSGHHMHGAASPELKRPLSTPRPSQHASTPAAALRECASTKQWRLALELLREAPRARTQQDIKIYIYNIAANACGKSGQWQQALSLLRESREVKLEPDVFSRTLLESARATGGSDGSMRCFCSASCPR
ncbi:unnamed protein product [Prorocentrum cordatum]|uniref:Uncharacterized protein n=1 Tax=Prorocentrum cordatum TaxID=2364126 RepID=A0ABN9WVN5_9DINO|nr:unnamed protein product [Polarella glacialis]